MCSLIGVSAKGRRLDKLNNYGVWFPQVWYVGIPYAWSLDTPSNYEAYTELIQEIVMIAQSLQWFMKCDHGFSHASASADFPAFFRLRFRWVGGVQLPATGEPGRDVSAARDEAVGLVRRCSPARQKSS